MAINLQMGLPREENFSSYSVMVFPMLMEGVFCKSRVRAVMVQVPEDFRVSSE